MARQTNNHVWTIDEPPFSKSRAWHRPIRKAYGLEAEYMNAMIESSNSENWTRIILLDELWETTH